MAIVQSRSGGAIAWRILKYALLGAGVVIMVVPFIDMFLGALRTPAERLANPPVYWPRDPQWINFKRVFTETPALIWFKNSIIITFAVTFIQLLTSSMAGYALAKFRFRGASLLFRGVLGAQMFPFFLFIIPVFFILRYFPMAGGNDLFGQGGSGFLNTYAAIILPFTITWYGIFLMRQFFMGVPDELLDAARLDGAGEFRIFFIIVLPLVLPGLATLGIFVFVYQWNEVIWTMTITRTAPDLQTLPVGIYLLRGAFADEATQSLQQAAVAVSIIPVMFTFLFLQRFYVRGLTAGAVKG
ncbi:MAG: carbohydrate ABC transporter permease [Defluviimonas sp.]|uniref:carbohydrate ABC transporter permease n=1 Tax=Albidovulum sp. TaxID=1872424 RepID=UPI002A2F1DFA|nr:carbohydrate ABC transporter permease [Defluviimonas sp.]